MTKKQNKYKQIRKGTGQSYMRNSELKDLLVKEGYWPDPDDKKKR